MSKDQGDERLALVISLEACPILAPSSSLSLLSSLNGQKSSLEPEKLSLLSRGMDMETLRTPFPPPREALSVG
jgi:hypothetical protein